MFQGKNEACQGPRRAQTGAFVARPLLAPFPFGGSTHGRNTLKGDHEVLAKSTPCAFLSEKWHTVGTPSRSRPRSSSIVHPEPSHLYVTLLENATDAGGETPGLPIGFYTNAFDEARSISLKDFHIIRSADGRLKVDWCERVRSRWAAAKPSVPNQPEPKFEACPGSVSAPLRAPGGEGPASSTSPRNRRPPGRRMWMLVWCPRCSDAGTVGLRGMTLRSALRSRSSGAWPPGEIVGEYIDSDRR